MMADEDGFSARSEEYDDKPSFQSKFYFSFYLAIRKFVNYL